MFYTDVDLKQSQQKLEHLIENKDRMEDGSVENSSEFHSSYKGENHWL